MSAVFAASATFGRGSISFVGVGGTQDAISFGANCVPDVEHAHAGVVVGREDRLLALERARPVLVQVVRAERAERRSSRGRVGVGSVAIGTGFSGARTSTTKVWNMPLAHFSALASSATTASLRPGSGSGVCVPPGNGGDQLMCDSSFGLAGSLMSWIVKPPSRHAP